MNLDYDFIIDGFLFESVSSDDYVVDSSVIPLFSRYQDILTDDFWSKNPEDFKKIIDLVFPYFFVVYDEKGKFYGYIYLSDWRSNGTCCAFHIVIDEKYHGHAVRKVAKKVAKKLFEKFNINRIDCTIPIYNKPTKAFAEIILGASFEGVQKARSFKNGKPLDYLMYALINKGE